MFASFTGLGHGQNCPFQKFNIPLLSLKQTVHICLEQPSSPKWWNCFPSYLPGSSKEGEGGTNKKTRRRLAWIRANHQNSIGPYVPMSLSKAPGSIGLGPGWKGNECEGAEPGRGRGEWVSMILQIAFELCMIGNPMSLCRWMRA